MATGKPSTLPFRIAPTLKEVLHMAADHEHSSISNMVDVLIREHCARDGISISRQVPPFWGVDTLPINR